MTATKTTAAAMPLFERYLSLWVAACIGAGILLGRWWPDVFERIAGFEMGGINLAVTVLVWLMIYPMMLQVDFAGIKNAGRQPKGLALTLVVNWVIKPFSMALIAWFFIGELFSAWIPAAQGQEYIAGAILLGIAPCTAMVFVWSYLSRGDAAYTLLQVSVNDLIILAAFVPLAGFLLGINDISIPYDTLAFSVVLFVVVPLLAGFLSRRLLIRSKGEEWFKTRFLGALRPLSIIALLATLVLLFALQGDVIAKKPLVILLIAIPLTLQTYFIFFLSWVAGRWLRLPHAICAPAAMIGASNFFELAVAVAIALFGLHSGAALATVVGVLTEVPVMLSLVYIANRWRY